MVLNENTISLSSTVSTQCRKIYFVNTVMTEVAKQLTCATLWGAK